MRTDRHEAISRFRNAANAPTTDLKRCELCEVRLDYFACGMRSVTALVSTVTSLPLTDDVGILDQPSEY
jgi:hypothetical protein